jgi:tetratricopeptide (TPR) repeat protein
MRRQVPIAIALTGALSFGAVASHASAQRGRRQEQPPPASAPSDRASADDAARWLFNSARDAFEAGDYETALERFQQSYQLSHRPALLFNIGTTLDRLRRDADALAAFEQYLELVPDAPNRGEIEGRAAVLRQSIEEAQQQEAERARIEAERQAAEQARIEAEQRAAAEREADEGVPAWAFWTVAGTGGGTLVGAIVTEILTAGRNDDYEAYVRSQVPGADAYATARGLYDDARTMRNVSIGLYCATAALAAGAGIMVPFTNWGGDEDDPAAPSGQAGLSFDQGGLTLDLRHRF